MITPYCITIQTKYRQQKQTLTISSKCSKKQLPAELLSAIRLNSPIQSATTNSREAAARSDSAYWGELNPRNVVITVDYCIFVTQNGGIKYLTWKKNKVGWNHSIFSQMTTVTNRSLLIRWTALQGLWSTPGTACGLGRGWWTSCQDSSAQREKCAWRRVRVDLSNDFLFDTFWQWDDSIYGTSKA